MAAGSGKGFPGITIDAQQWMQNPGKASSLPLSPRESADLRPRLAHLDSPSMSGCPRRFGPSLLLLSLVAPVFLSGLTISGYSEAANDRFFNDPGFLLADYDVSGVARSSDGKWGTLVSNNVFLSANHLHPAIGSTLTFFTGNDPNGSTVTRTVTSGQRLVTGVDLWVGVLDTPVDSSITSYAFPSTDINSTTDLYNTILPSAAAVMTGKTPGSDGTLGLTDMAFGLNRIDLFADEVTVGDSTNSAILADDDTGTGNPMVSYESYLVGGDSGAPLFLPLNDGSSFALLLLGINWFNGTAEFTSGGETVETNISGFTYLGNYDTELSAYISANAVPEPATWGFLIGLATLVGALRRRRHRIRI